MTLKWLRSAVATRVAQLNYIAQTNPKAAANQGNHIDTEVRRLLRYPYLGRVGVKHGTRELVITGTPFVLVYRIRIRAKRIEIVDLWHSAQNITQGP